MRSIPWALAALTTVAACSSESSTAPAAGPSQRPAFAVGSECSNVKGTVRANFVSETEVEGTISGDVAGQAFATIQSITAKKNGIADVTLTHRYVTPDGEIFTSDKGTLRPISEMIGGYGDWFDFDNRLTVVGGTGAYAGATGTLRARGLLNPFITAAANYGPGGIQLEYSGRVCAGVGDPLAEVAP